METPKRFQRTIGGRALTIETGKVANQAHGSVTVSYGDTVVLVTACIATKPRQGVDFLPLTVDFEERLYAAGKIPGSFFRREGRPGQAAVLTGRLIDRPLRPLFPKHLHNDVQVIVTVLSTDQENEPDIPAIVGASAALGISPIPFDGPVAGSRVGYVDGELVLNPIYSDLSKSNLDLVVVGTRNAVIMVEAEAKEVSEDIALDAVRFGQEANADLLDMVDEIVQECGKTKMKFSDEGPTEVEGSVLGPYEGRLAELLQLPYRVDRESAIEQLQKEAAEKLGPQHSPEAIAEAFQSRLKQDVRSKILGKGIRPDGRNLEDIRDLSCEVSVLPRTHGSGMFNRGQTQVVTITTLGSMGEEQKIDTIGQEETKRFMHHYNFLPFSVGEVKRVGSPGRREVGHGALAERALEPVIPDEDEFPYTIRLVSEVLSSNGSTSMASVCGSTLSLMDAGVPIKAPVAGVAMGLVTDDNGQYAVLTDIAGLEDAMGDMDFKVAGTDQGMTAWQMDLKIKGISYEIMRDAMSQAVEARKRILDVMTRTISSSRTELSPYAPRMTRITIDKEKIGNIIGPGGKTIRSIIEETGTTINVENDGTVLIGSTSLEATQRAVEMIESLTKEVEVGGIYTGKVTRIMNFGAFVEILPGKEGLVHISELADYRVGKVEDEVNIDDEITVMVVEIDQLGRINLSRRATLQSLSQVGAGEEREARPYRPSQPRGDRGNSQEHRREGRHGDRRPYRGEGGSRPQSNRGPRR